MKLYLIERKIPGAGKLSLAERKAIAQRSVAVIKELGNKNLKWHHSYITADNLWCVYDAVNEEFLREHAKRGSFPCDNIREVSGMLSPATATLELEALSNN
jgi:hypothetical protein